MNQNNIKTLTLIQDFFTYNKEEVTEAVLLKIIKKLKRFDDGITYKVNNVNDTVEIKFQISISVYNGKRYEPRYEELVLVSKKLSKNIYKNMCFMANNFYVILQTYNVCIDSVEIDIN